MKFYWEEKDVPLSEILTELSKQYADYHNDYGSETKEGKMKIYNLQVLIDAAELVEDELDVIEKKNRENLSANKK